MKRISVLVVFFVIIALPQPTLAIQQWGVKFGYASASQVWEHRIINQDDMSWRSGITASIYAQFFDYSGLSMITGLDYIQKGTGFETYGEWGVPPHEKSTHYSLYHYLSVPLFAKYTVETDIISPHFIFGARVSYFLSYEDDLDHLYWGFEDEWDDFVFEICMGIGLEKCIFTDQIISLEFLYYYEPLWQYDEYIPFFDTDLRIKNTSFTIMLGYGFK